MEIWATVLVALIVALSTLGATFIQSRYSSKRFERELKRAREVEEQQRRREVRSEPLLKLRRQLGEDVSRNEKVVRYATLKRIRLVAEKAGQTLLGSGDELKNAIRDVNDYIDSGEIDQTLFMVDDKAIRDGVRQLNTMIFQAWQDVLPLGEAITIISVEELNKSLTLAERIEAKTTEVQELINKRLEEL